MADLPTHRASSSLLAAIEESERRGRALYTTIENRVAIILPYVEGENPAEQAARVHRVLQALEALADD